MSQCLKLLLWIVVIELLGFASGLVTKSGVSDWYLAINKSSLTPPGVVFPIVWSSLYALIATSGWLIWRDHRKVQLARIKCVFIVQLVINFLWTPVFFYFHFTGLALLIIAGILLSVTYIFIKLLKHLQLAAWLLLPYFLWSCLAFYLNLYIWCYN